MASLLMSNYTLLIPIPPKTPSIHKRAIREARDAPALICLVQQLIPSHPLPIPPLHNNYLIREVFLQRKANKFCPGRWKSWQKRLCDCNQPAWGFQFLFSLGSHWLLLFRDVYTVAEEISLVGLLMPSSPS